MKIFQPFSLVVLRGVKVAAIPNLNPALFTLVWFSPKRFSSVSSSPNPIVANYLRETFGFSQTLANPISKRYCKAKSLENAQAVLLFLRDVGFSEPQIRNSIRVSPQLLYFDIDKNLRPKIQYFQQQLGLVGADLGTLISRNSKFLTCSLEKKLVPWIEILKETLSNDGKNGDLLRVLRRCSWVMCGSPKLLLSNIEFLRSCGIVGSQLSTLLVQCPRLLGFKHSDLKQLVSRAVDMGFSIESRMLVYAVRTIGSLSDEAWRKKFELFHSWGFTEQECIEMFRRTPGLLLTSKEKLELGMKFFMHTIKFDKTILFRNPVILRFSMENRVIPRYKVIQILKLKCLLKKEPRFIAVLKLADEAFRDRFILRYADHAEELLAAYKGHRSG